MGWKPDGYKCKYSSDDHHRGVYEEGFDDAVEAVLNDADMIKNYRVLVAARIAQTEDPGAQVVRLLQEIDECLPTSKMFKGGCLITQAVPEDGRNPIIHVTVFSNQETDFPIGSTEGYIEWVREYYESIKDMQPEEG